MSKNINALRQGLPADRCPQTNKVMWPTEEQARIEAKFMRKKYGSRVKEYSCRHCASWHIGHWRPAHRRRVVVPLNAAVGASDHGEGSTV